MSALSDLQKKLEQEAQGIMFPFSASAANVSTTQNVYDSATDGIMTMQGQKYVGPDAVIQYGTEEQDFQRQLKQIEAPMLPQFDSTQFPQAGEGIMQTPTPAPAPPTTPVEPETPAIDPCPPGFRFDPVKKVCVPIEQPQDKDDKPDAGQLDFRRNIGPTAKGLGIAIKSFQKNNISGSTKGDINLRISNDIPLLALIPIVGNPLRLYLKNQADKDLASLDVADGITVTKNADGSNQLKITDEGRTSFGRLQTKESLAGNIASTQKKTALGTIEKAPNGQNMIVGPIALSYFGKQLFPERKEIISAKEAKAVDTLNQDEKNKLIEELNAALGITTPEPEKPFERPTEPATGLTVDFGDLQTIPKVNSQTEEFVGTVNSRLMKDTGTSLKLASILMEIKETGRELANPVTRDMAQEKLKEQEEDAFNAFNTSIEEDRKKGGDYANNLTKAQADYLNSNDRIALPGESKGSNGYLAGARQKNEPTKENSGYGFKATQANYKKSTNTFDQRFK
jgi:hypothetical protein